MGDGKVAHSELGQLADALNGALREAEDAIRARGFGVSAFVNFDVPAGGCESPARCSLLFVKYDNRWGLHVQYENGEMVHVCTATMIVRKHAAAVVPALYERLKVVEREHKNGMQLEIDRLRDFVQCLEKDRCEANSSIA